MRLGEFENRILTCIDQGLDYLGESTKYAIYWHLEHTFGLKKSKIPNRPEEFLRALKRIYGIGALLIEKNIVREINKEFDIEAEGLVEAVKKAKKQGK